MPCLLIASAVGSLFPDDAHGYAGNYNNGHGWATLSSEAGPANEVRWEYYTIGGTGAVTASSPWVVNITYRKSGSADQVYYCETACPQSVTITIPGGGTWSSDSVFYRGAVYWFMEDVFADPIDFSSGSRKVIRVFHSPTGTWKHAQNLQPSVRNRWYYNVTETGFFQTKIVPTVALTSGPVIPGVSYPQAQILTGTLKHGAIGDAHIQSVGPQTMPSGSGGSTLNYSGSGFADGWKNMWGYVEFSNGATPTMSGSFTDLIIGVDRQVPTISCQLYKMDGVTPLTNRNTAESGVKVKVTAVDQAGLSGVGVGEIWLKKGNSGTWTKVGGAGNAAQDITPNVSGDIDSLVTVDLPITLPGEDNTPFYIGFRARDNAYGAAGLQDHWTEPTVGGPNFNYCGGSSASDPIIKHNIDLEVQEYKLYTDAARSQEVSTGVGLEPGVTRLYGRITVVNKSMGEPGDAYNFKIGHYESDSVPPNPDPSSLSVDRQQTVAFLPGQYCLVNAPVCGFTPPATYNTYTWEFDFVVPSTIGLKTSYAFVDYDGLINEVDDALPNWDNLVRVDYTVGENQWFSTTGGDVAANWEVDISQDPASGAQSSFMVIQGDSGVSTTEGLWKMGGYNRNLYPLVGGPHASSLFNHLRPKIQDSVSGDYDHPGSDDGDRVVCNQHAGGTYNLGSNEAQAWRDYKSFVIRCTDTGVNDEIWGDEGSTPAQPNGNNVYILPADLIIDGDFTCCRPLVPAPSPCDGFPNDKCLNIFIVEGDMEISTNATIVDGVFIVGGTFRDYRTGESVYSSNPLTINGAVYAHNMELERTMTVGGGATPALTVNFNLGLYMMFEEVCGEDVNYEPRLITCYSLGGRQLDWKEIAP